MSGVLLACCFPPFRPLLLPFVALVPLTVHVVGLPGTDPGRRSAARAGAIFGAIHFGLLLYWILIALIWFTPLAVPAYVGTLAALAALSALFAWLLHAAVRDVGAPVWLALPVTWTAVEWLRGHLPDALAFPWLGLGTSLTAYPHVVGFAELVGARGVGTWIALVNGLVVALLLQQGGRRRAAMAAVLAAVLIVPPAWGLWRAGSLPLREAGRVAVVQPDVPEHLKLDAERATDTTRASLATLFPSVEPGSVDLVVLPEVVFPSIYPEAPEAPAEVGFLAAWSGTLGAPILFGGLGYSEVGGYPVPYNSAFVVDAEGLMPFRYDKRALVPGVERVPFLPTGWVGRTGAFGGYGVGRGWPLARVHGTAYGVLICYESSYPELARRLRREGADVLVNVTNDAWYGRDPWYARTSALWQHPAHLVMRAIEGRVGIARAANTGISMFVDPVGRVHEASELFRPDVRTATVRTTDVTTLYVRLGDVIGTSCAVAGLALLVASLAARRRRGGVPVGPGGHDLDPTDHGH